MGELDAAFVRPQLRVVDTLSLARLAIQRKVVTLPPGNFLPGQGVLTAVELAGELFVVYPWRGGTRRDCRT